SIDSRHRCCEGLTALVRLEKVILDRDRGTELIDAQAQAAGMRGEQGVIGRQGGVGAQVEVAPRSLPREDVSRAALVAGIKSGDLAFPDGNPLVANLDLLQIGVELNRVGVRGYPRAAFRQRREPRPDVQVVLKKAGAIVRTVQELTPRHPVTFQ